MTREISEMVLKYVHIICIVADWIVYKEEEMASFTITGIGKLVFILLETRCPESGVEP